MTAAGKSHILCAFPWRPLSLVAITIALLSSHALGQLDSATLAGHVVDPSGIGIRGARVTLIDVARNTKTSRLTGRNGFYVFPDVKPGSYRVEISAPGFRMAQLSSLVLNTADTVQHNFSLTAGPDAIGIGSSGSTVRTSGAVSTVVDQNLVKELPLNGRSFQTLFQLTPGVVITPTSFASQGQFSMNGQRTNTNYFLIDGVSANFGISVSANPGQSSGGSLPALTALGGTNSLVPVDDVQEFAILTSSFAPEFGRSPGAQISIVTRSGTNEIHGEAFDYLRNDVLDANDWFANQHDLKRAALRQNDFGFVLGGPIRQSRTFFFVSYEGLRLQQPTTGESDVPSIAARQSAVPLMRPFLNAYPLPTGPDEGNGLAPATYAFSNPSRLDGFSLRIDHHFGDALSIFGRYDISSSEQRVRGANIASLNSVTDLDFALQTFTVGVSWAVSSHVANAARVNWSRSSATFDDTLDSFGGAASISPESVLPEPLSARASLFQFLPSLAGQHLELTMGRNVGNLQSQINLVDSLTWEIGAHSFKSGFDFRELSSVTRRAIYNQEALFLDMSAAIDGISSLSLVQSSTPVHSSFLNLSLFIEDSWRLARRLSLTYGLRWDFNPAPTGRGDNGLTPFTVVGFNNLPALSVGPPGSALYQATANNFAPRIGLAYQLHNSPKANSMIRGGVGVFYDFSSGGAGNALSAINSPFTMTKVLNAVPFPLRSNDAVAPPLTPNPPFGRIVAFPPVLKLPYTYQWNISLEQSLGQNHTLSVGYIGSAGHDLLRTDQYVGGQAGVPLAFEQLLFTNNGGYSNYNALQIELRRRASRNLDVVASYTYSHALDNASTDVQLNLPEHLSAFHSDYGSSDFDIRHVTTVGANYLCPAVDGSVLRKALFSDWAVDAIVIYRSAPPVDVLLSNVADLGISIRPDRVAGVPVYIEDSSVAGKVRINPLAFSVPVDGQGNSGRNSLRGFSIFQSDLAVRRRFHLSRKVSVQLRAEAFNLFNHPSFAPPSGQLGTVSPAGNLIAQNGFGVSASTLGSGFQTGGPGSGFSPLYQVGQARSGQATLKVEF